MSSKAFLLQECENIKKVLEETLRYKYGLDGSKEFYEECQVRREFIEQEIRSAEETDHSALQTNGEFLNELSDLISRIERSSLGEYSWPFVEELKKIASSICTEDTLANPDSPPKVYVLSDGRLDAYRIYPEPNRPSASKKRILTIVFPRTLKHFVLLHPILGHEIGHAIWRCSKHQKQLRLVVNDELVNSGGRFASSDATADWIFDQNPPKAAQEYLSQLLSYGINKKLLFEWADWEAWKEELLCDLIGLLIFGPSFVAAQCELLYALLPSGAGFGEEHPPVGCRVNMVITAAKILGYDSTDKLPDGDVKVAATKFWQYVNTKRQTDAWFDIFSEEQLTKALDRISDLLRKYPPSLYQGPTPDIIDSLFSQISKQVPPVGFKIDAENDAKCDLVDFRHILYSGWIYAKHKPEMPFLTLNRLCEHAVMQQRGIEQFLKG